MNINNKTKGHSRLLMLEVDEKGYIHTCSERLLDLLGHKADIINKHISSVIDFVTATYNFENIKDIIDIEDSFSIEHRMITSDKKYINVYAQYWYEEDEDNEEKYIFINFINTTKSKAKETKSINKNLLYEKFLERVDSKVGMFNDRGELIYYNKSMDKFLEAINITCIDKKDINIFGSAISKRINEVSQNHELKYEFEHCFELGKQTKCFRIIIQGLQKGKGSIAMLDIHKEKMYHQVLDNAKVGIVFEGEEGITYLNSKACEILQISEKESQKKLVEYIDFEHKLKFLEKFYNPDKVNSFESCVKKISNNDVAISMNSETINIDNEDLRVYILQDKCLGLSNNSNSELLYDNRIDILEAREYDRLKNEFFANISHELRTPINVIFSIVQLMEIRQKKLDIEHKRYNKILKQNCYRLLRLINNLIEITKIDAGHVRLKLANYNMINIVEEITLSVADYIESKGLNLVFDTNIEEQIMACDVEKIECIVLNLLANASKFTKPGDYIEVYIDEMEDDYLKIRIKDTGQGIPQAKKDIIFKRFRQVDKSLYREHEGSGIGLSLVKSYVELHGGEIIVESEEGKGSEFIIIFPIRIVEENDIKKCEDYNSHRVIDRINIEFSDIYFNEWEMQNRQ